MLDGTWAPQFSTVPTTPYYLTPRFFPFLVSCLAPESIWVCDPLHNEPVEDKKPILCPL